MADLTLPHGEILTVEQTDQGAQVFGVQRNLNRCGLFPDLHKISEDGIYGDQTRWRVNKFQERRALDKDGRFGPDTSISMSHLLQDIVLIQSTKPLPPGILRSVTHLESSDYVAANNWEVAGGVDLSYVQRRVYGPPFDETAIKRAFDGLYQFGLMARSFRERHDTYWQSPKVPTHEAAWRLAVEYHNYQSLANRIAQVGVSGLSSYYTSTQSWVTDLNRHFDDDEPVRTPYEYGQFYALGAPEHNHEGVAVRGVTNWDVE